MKKQIAVGITGASGAIYSVRLLEVLLAAGNDVHLCISPAGQQVLEHELDITVDLDNFNSNDLFLGDPDKDDSKLSLLRDSAGISSEDSSILGENLGKPGKLIYHHHQDYTAQMASGSALIDSMVVVPCSGSTLSGIAHGSSRNLIQRAAEVALKERRKLIIVTRETPLSLSHIENMRAVTLAGAVILPAAPGWYHQVKTVRDLVDFIVNRICDQLDVPNALVDRWGNV